MVMLDTTDRAPTTAHALLSTQVDQHAPCHCVDDLDEKLGGVEAPPPRRPLLRQLGYVLTVLCSLAYAATGGPPPRRPARLPLRHSRGGRVLDATAPWLSQNSDVRLPRRLSPRRRAPRPGRLRRLRSPSRNGSVWLRNGCTGAPRGGHSMAPG
jgi:hypothetical protein